MQVDHEREGLEQQARLEARDVGAVALADVEHAHHLEGLDRLPHRAAGEAEVLRELLLGRQPHSGRELAEQDHLPDLQDRAVGDRHDAILGNPGIGQSRSALAISSVCSAALRFVEPVAGDADAGRADTATARPPSARDELEADERPGALVRAAPPAPT